MEQQYTRQASLDKEQSELGWSQSIQPQEHQVNANYQNPRIGS